MSLIENNVPITGPVTPWYTEDTFPSHIETYGQGGYRSVADAASRLLIIPERRLEGMVVKQLSDSTYWTLSGGILDANWLQVFGIVDDLAYQVVSTFTSLPAIGNASLIYLVLDTKVYYTWNGSAYVSVNSTVPSGALTNNLGNWNATTNSPTITGGTGTAGDFYIVSVAGTTTIDGIFSWEIGDYIWFDDSTSAWRKIDNQSTVSSGNRLEVVVVNETELVAAFELINNNYVGGVIRIGAEITLTANRSFNHDNITVECDYNRFYMNGYTITINGGSCFYNNGFFDGGGAVSKFIFTASSGSTNYVFNNTRFYDFVEIGSRDVFDMSGGTTSMHLFLKDCWMTGNTTISSNVVQIKVGGGNAMADATILSNRTLNVTTQTNKYGFIGALPSDLASRLQYIYDGSTVCDTSVLTPGTIYNIINGTMTYPSAGIPISTGSAWGTSITNNSTNWDTAYTHSQDNTQAHSDYLLNNANDTTSGTITAAGFTTAGTTSSGNVGIGTTTPSSTLDVHGGKLVVESNSGAYGQLQLLNTENGEVSMVFVSNVTGGQGVTPTTSDNKYLWSIGAGAYGIGQDKFSIVANAAYNGSIITATHTGNVGVGTTTPGYPLDVVGLVKTSGGYINTTDYFEKIFQDPITFTSAANRAVNIKLGLTDHWGYIEVEITGTFYSQNSVGKLTKVFAIGAGANQSIYCNESRVVDALGTIVDNISIGEFQFDAVNQEYIIPISHISSNLNPYTIKVRAFSRGGTAMNTLNNISISAEYALTALPRNYVYFNTNVGIGTTTPNYKLDVSGGTINCHSSSATAGYISTGNYQGTGSAARFPSGIYSDGPNYLYGSIIVDGNGIQPNNNNTSSLGNASYQFGDLFLGEGGVINWDNGDVTLTQSDNTLTVAGGSLTVTSNTVTATNFILSSDERLKTDIKPLQPKSIDVEYKQFELISEPNQLRYGVIAQELEKTHPELIRTDSEGIKSVAYIDLLLSEVAYLKDRVKQLEEKING